MRIMTPYCFINFYLKTFISKYVARVLRYFFHILGNVRFIVNVYYCHKGFFSTKLGSFFFSLKQPHTLTTEQI